MISESFRTYPNKCLLALSDHPLLDRYRITHNIVGYEAKTNWVGLSRQHVLVSGLNHCVPLLSLFKDIIVPVIGVQQDRIKT